MIKFMEVNKDRLFEEGPLFPYIGEHYIHGELGTVCLKFDKYSHIFIYWTTTNCVLPRHCKNYISDEEKVYFELEVPSFYA